MGKIKFFIIFLFLGALLFGQKQQKGFLELKSRYGFNVRRLPPFSINLAVNYNTRTWQPELLLATAVQNDYLQFTHQGAAYKARYQIQLAIRDTKQTLYTQSWNETVILKNFRQTNSRRMFQEKLYRLKGFTLPADRPYGREELVCLGEVRDMISNQSHSFKQTFKIVYSPADSAWLSPIEFLRRDPDSGSGFRPAPRQKALRYNHPYFAWSLLHLPAQPKITVHLYLQKKDEQGYQLIDQRKWILHPDSGFARIIYPLPYKVLNEGSYLLRMRWQKKEVRKEFELIWFGKPIYLYKTDLALRPLKYLLTAQQYDSVNSLSMKQLNNWFKKFWKAQDKTKDTNFNELKNEFYRRVDFANSRFSTRSKEGWETDRGKIYLLYGEPAKIENRRYATDTLPYLVWIYNDSLQFIFVDKAKNGEFFLIANEAKE